MECPVCGDKLRPIERYGVEVDICPGCKGVWLDRGELEKVIDLAEKGGPGAETMPGARREEPRREEPRHEAYREQEYGHHDGYRKRKKRGSWLGDLLEGFGDE